MDLSRGPRSKTSAIRLAVLTEYQMVTDRQADRHFATALYHAVHVNSRAKTVGRDAGMRDE